MRGESDLDEMLGALDVEGFLHWQGVDYKVTHGRSGTQLNVRECPRCGGTGWKVYLNAETGLGSCFHGACAGEPGFNKFSFTRHLVGSAGEARRIITTYLRSAGWRPKPKPRALVAETPKSDLKLPECSPLPKPHAYIEDGWMPPYLEERGFDRSDATFFEWHYCDEGFHDPVPGDPSTRQNFSKRIIIPVRNLESQLVTFQGRDITGRASRKYLFPAGLPATGRLLYNAHNCLGLSEVVVGEGAFDVAAIRRALAMDITLSGVGAIGTFGKMLSDAGDDDQMSDFLVLKAHGLKSVTIMWDGEQKTLKDAVKTALLLHSRGFETRVAVLPLDKDPNEVPCETVVEAFLTAYPVTASSATRLIALASLGKLRPRSLGSL